MRLEKIVKEIVKRRVKKIIMKPISTKLQPEEIKELKKIIEKTVFYRQAAASKIIYISLPAIGVLNELSYPAFYCFSKEFEGYYQLEGFNKEAKQAIEKCRKNTRFIDDYYARFQQVLEELTVSLKKTERVDLPNISLTEFQAILREINDKNYLMWYNAFLVDKFDPQGEELLKGELKNYHLNAEELSTLIRAQKLNFIEESNLELHEIALRRKDGKATEQEMLGELRTFLKKYYYIQNSWNQAINLQEKDILGTLKDILRKSKEKIQETVDYYNHHTEIIKERVCHIFSKHHLPAELENIFHLFRVLAMIRDERKETVLIGTHIYELTAQRFSKEYSVPIDLIRTALPNELAEVKNKKELRQLLPLFEERAQGAVISTTNEKTFIVGGETAQKMIAILHHKLLTEAEQIKGKVACKGSGKIRGKVKIILGETHFTKFEEGDILVAAMTRPEYVPLMKKAKAIITDEGGLTCHAAVISRELNVPCIIGTKIATKKLFDETEVIIDTEEGTITPVFEIDQEHRSEVSPHQSEASHRHQEKSNSNKKIWVLEDKRTEASPFPLIFNLESGCGKDSPAQKYLGCNISGMLIHFYEDSWGFYERKGALKKMGEALAERIKNDPLFIEKTLDNTYRLGRKLLKLTREISTTDLRKKSNKELWDYYSEYRTRINEVRGPAWLAPGLDTSGVFTRILEKILEEKKGTVQDFATLTNPEKKTKGKEQDIHLLELGVKIKQDKTLKKLFENNPEKIVQQLQDFPELKKKLEDHEQEYRWLPCTYENKAYDLTNFVSALSSIVKGNPSRELEEIKTKEKKNWENKLIVKKKLRLNREEERLFDTASEMIFFKADRKDIFFQSYYEVRRLIEEIGRRIGLRAKDTMYLLPEEVKTSLLENKFNNKEIQQRRKDCVIYCDNGPIKIISGKEARAYIKKYAEEEFIPNVSELKGSCANTGYAKGRAKLILAPKDMIKMNEGDILIANATNPDIVPAMKKASAIVTNSGGITCHAAIVSRELGKPAVIGTKIATEVIKDNDLVEVDADKGIVRIIKSKKNE